MNNNTFNKGENVLIVFVKYPEEGKVKTRLAKSIGAKQAAFLYRYFVGMVLENTKNDFFERQIFYCPEDHLSGMKQWLGDEEFFSQQGNSLGQRLSYAFKKAFDEGAKKVVAIGTDNPLVDSVMIENVFNSLDVYPCVIGPSFDGGYYLLGLSCFEGLLFEDIEWSSQYVFEETISRLQEARMHYKMIDKSLDIDTLQDLFILRTMLEGRNDLEELNSKIGSILSEK